jgi:hypothetical protein
LAGLKSSNRASQVSSVESIPAKRCRVSPRPPKPPPLSVSPPHFPLLLRPSLLSAEMDQDEKHNRRCPPACPTSCAPPASHRRREAPLPATRSILLPTPNMFSSQARLVILQATRASTASAPLAHPSSCAPLACHRRQETLSPAPRPVLLPLP